MYFNPNMQMNRGCGCSTAPTPANTSCGCNTAPTMPIGGCGCNTAPMMPSGGCGCNTAPTNCGCEFNFTPSPITLPCREQECHRVRCHEQTVIQPVHNRTVTHHVPVPRVFVQQSFSEEHVIEQSNVTPFNNASMTGINFNNFM